MVAMLLEKAKRVHLLVELETVVAKLMLSLKVYFIVASQYLNCIMVCPSIRICLYLHQCNCIPKGVGLRFKDVLSIS